MNIPRYVDCVYVFYIKTSFRKNIREIRSNDNNKTKKKKRPRLGSIGQQITVFAFPNGPLYLTESYACCDCQMKCRALDLSPCLKNRGCVHEMRLNDHYQ